MKQNLRHATHFVKHSFSDIPRCQSVRSSVYGVGRTESVSVACEVDASPTAVTFAWALDDSKILSSDQYHTNGTRSVATISPRSPQDYGVLKCWATNTVGRQKEPCSFRIIPAGEFSRIIIICDFEACQL